MIRSKVAAGALILVLLMAGILPAQRSNRIDLIHADNFEVVLSRFQDTTFAIGAVVLETESGRIYCDSAVWLKGLALMLRGNVIIDDLEYRLVADSVYYDLKANQARALGSRVELLSRADSLFAVGSHAFLDRDRDYFYMLERPTLFLNYPDTSAMIEVIADIVEYDAGRQLAEVYGDVKINSADIVATSGCAVMYPETHTFDLFENPVLIRRKSRISGALISIITDGSEVQQVDVIDSAHAEFTEPTDSTETEFDRSELAGRRIKMKFSGGELRTVACYGQAYSWYFPATKPGQDVVENTVSGDTIRFLIDQERLLMVDVVGGARGTYLSTTTKVEIGPADSTGDTTGTTKTDTTVFAQNKTSETDLDSTGDTTRVSPTDTIVFAVVDTSEIRSLDTTLVAVTDTIDYQAHHIIYNLPDSLILLKTGAKTKSGTANLEAYLIEFDTKARVIEAFSGSIETDSDTILPENQFADELQPNAIPVILRDGAQVMYGDYLQYSIDTQKGRILTSKSAYETGFFYGDDLYRQQEDIFYLQDGRYTTCNADEPHFHFHSNNLKLMEDDKLIARPVVLSIGRLPILALPYYVFPLKKGRHSGFLPFTLGNIERGDRFIRNVGYYWAASEYWDWQGALDYFENRRSINFFSRVNYRKLYAFDGTLSGNYARETSYNQFIASEKKSTRWTVSAAHNHQFSPSFKINAKGSLQSDANYYNDFSTDLEKRLNRVVRSDVNFSKGFGRSVTISGKLAHDDNLDTESRTDQLPSLGVRLPAFRPFGDGRLNSEGRLERKWYNEMIVTYRPSLLNFSSRIKVDSIENVLLDTIFIEDTVITVIDTLIPIADTVITIDTSIFIASQDTVSYRSRKKFTRIDHTMRINFPTKIARYIIFNPSFSYSENWTKIHETDQSLQRLIDASPVYRTYRYNFGASASTKIYGTVYPQVLGLVGLRQVITPTVSYRFVPEIDRHPDVSGYAGASARSLRKSQSMIFSLNHVYQAKVKSGEMERNFELVTITSGFNYDFERELRKLSDMNTSFNSSLLPRITFYGNLHHTFYPEGSDDADLLKPRLLDFSVNANLSLRGRHFLFDDPGVAFPRGVDSASQLPAGLPGSTAAGSPGWNMSASYGYTESGRGEENFRKKSFLRFNLNFNLTPATKVRYSQYYDFAEKKTINSQVSLVRQLHCWLGTFYWVPTGSNKGWGFRLSVIAIPAIRIDNSTNNLSGSFFQTR